MFNFLIILKKLTQKFKFYEKSPNFWKTETLIFQKCTNWVIDHHNRYKTCYKQSINQQQWSILANFIQLNVITNFLMNTWTLISKFFINHEFFFKLKHRIHVNNMHTQKPINLFKSKTPKIIKNPKFLNFEIFEENDKFMHECM